MDEAIERACSEKVSILVGLERPAPGGCLTIFGILTYSALPHSIVTLESKCAVIPSGFPRGQVKGLPFRNTYRGGIVWYHIRTDL